MQRNEKLIVVITRNNNDPDDVTRKVINYYRRDTRKWLANHQQWAMHNDRTVTLDPNP